MWQLDVYGDVLPTVEATPAGEFENGEEEAQRFAEWCQLQSDIELELKQEYE